MQFVHGMIVRVCISLKALPIFLSNTQKIIIHEKVLFREGRPNQWVTAQFLKQFKNHFAADLLSKKR